MDNRITHEELENLGLTQNEFYKDYLEKLVDIPLPIIDALSLLLLWMVQETDSTGTSLVVKTLRTLDKDYIEKLTLTFLTMMVSEAKLTYSDEEGKVTVKNAFDNIFNNTINGYKESKAAEILTGWEANNENIQD